MKYKIIFIIISVVAMIGTVLYIALDKANKQYKTFVGDGYILSSSNDKNSNASVKYYFNANSKYKSKYPSSITFSDIDGNNIITESDCIIHYLNGSISVLKKSVIINTDELNTTTLKYYNLFEQTVLGNNDGVYSANNAGKKINFTNFIIKLSDTKFLLVSKNINLKFGDTEKNISGYLEMNIIDGNIIKLENQEVSYQTIASDSYIILGGNTKLDLSTNQVLYKGKEKFSLSQLVIDSDDNIPIALDEPIDSSDNNNSGNGGINIGDNETDNGDNGNEEEDEVSKLPTFEIANMEVSTNKIDATVKITDENNMLTGNVVTKIVESSSSKVVYTKEDSTGIFTLDVMVENLLPNTSYTLIINSDYVKDGITYNRDFLIKSFRTELLGISFTKDYFTKTKMSFTVKTENYSNIKSAELILLNSDEQVIKQVAIDANVAKNEDGTNILFENLTPNTSYIVKLTNFLYDGVIISGEYEIKQEYKTLKNKPTFGDTSFTIDKKNGLFTLKVNGVSDADNGIVNYKYEVYDARMLSEKNSTPLVAIEKNKLGTIDLPVDQTTVFRGVPYTFRLITEFYDNEKYIEYQSEYSDVFKMDGVPFPTLRFEPTNITFERIEGTLVIVDEGNTIPLENNIITVVYANSTGTSKSFTTSGNLSIPLSINNLRANETYTISIYTAVNLQDGNQVIDNCFVGSVVVKTQSAKEILTSYMVNTDVVTDAFSVTASLGAQNGTDNILEANTLTGLTFNLYSGQSTNSTLIKTVKKADRNLLPYISDLKQNYYDKTFLITPEFFGVANGDMTEEYYTIEITNAYDYTDYKNNIPVINQTVIVKSNGFVPALPPDINNSMEVNVICNKDAGDRYRSDLNPETIVGYQLRGSYDNSRMYAKYLKYYIYNADTNVVLDSEGTIVNVPENGYIDYVEFYLNDGTPYNITDNDFRRGNNYYFVYEAYLDLNFDGTVDTKYPYQEEGIQTVLKSSTISPAKQEPIFKIYPSTSTSDSLALKYMFTDVDNTLLNDRLYSKIGSSDKGYVDIQKNSSQYASVTIPNLSKGYLGIAIERALMKNAESVTRQTLMYQYFDSTFNMKNLSFHTNLDVNHLNISIIDYEENASYINRIAALKVTFTAGSNVIVKDYLPLDNDTVTIDLADIKDMINMNVNVSVQAYYDTGITGFETSNSIFALQSVLVDNIGGEYLTINSEDNLRGNAIANGSIYNITFNPNSLALSNLSSGKNKTFTTSCNQSGISFNYEYLLAKKLDVSNLVGDGTESFSFNTIIPGVSLLNTEGRLNISATLRTAQLNIKFYGANASQLKDNKFYVELYQTNETGTVNTFISETPVIVTGTNMAVNLSNLNPKTSYYVKLYGDVYNGTAYVRTQLYDIDFTINTKIYYFSTLSSVGISNVSVRYIASTYNNKNIRIAYNLNEIVGYDKIKYILTKYVEDEHGEMQKVPVSVQITDDVIFNRTMIKNIPCPPGSNFVFGQNYNLTIIPIAYVTINGQQTEVELDNIVDYDFALEQLRSPFVGIVGTATDDLGIEFKISISDIHKVIVGGTYSIKILDDLNNDITPIEYKNNEYPITTLNNTISINNLEQSRDYKIIVTTYVDRKNNMVDIEKIDTIYTKSTLDDSGIDIGNLYTAMNSIDKAKIDLLFYNSYKLTYITAVRYSIYNFSGYAQDNTINFIPSQVTTADGSYYMLTLPETLPATGIYYIELQFIYNNRVVKEVSVEHNYVGN